MEKEKVPDINQSLKELEELIHKPGYLYCLLIMVLHDLFLPLHEYLKVNWHERLSYQEVSFLFGLLIKDKLDLETIPVEEEVQKYIEKTYELMQEIHMFYSHTAFQSIMEEILERKKKGLPIPEKPKIFNTSEGIIEAVFYGDSGAYDFQYWESAPARYSQDKEWIEKHLGFSIQDAVSFAQKAKISTEKKLPVPTNGDFKIFCKGILDIFTVNISEISLERKKMENIVQQFASIPGESNKDLFYPSDPNQLVNKPLIKISEEDFLLPVSFDLSRAVDESPFYWIKEKDDSYFGIAQKHRGEYTEEIAYQKLKKVFGQSHTFRGVKIQRKVGEGIRKKGLVYTDIDVLVLYGNKAIVVQAKSKKMTHLARTGNLKQLGIDFRKAVQEAYNQGIKSRRHILDRDSVLLDSNGDEIKLDESINEAYILLVTTDAYPALYMQAYSFLEKQTDDPWPIALNIYDLDLISTYLVDPYDFLYYVNQRIVLADKILGGTELTCLGYHLDQKLFVDASSKATHIALGQDFGQVIDDDVMRQRYGTEQDKKKSKIRQKWRNERFEQLIFQVKDSNEPGFMDAIFFLFSLSSDTADSLINSIEQAKNKSLIDRRPHSVAMPMDNGISGITYVVEFDRSKNLHEHNLLYAQARKYKSRADEWLGIGSYALSPNLIDSMVYSKDKWQQDGNLEELTDVMLKKQNEVTKIKLGRNDPCYCGSGKKYKKCHLLKKYTA